VRIIGEGDDITITKTYGESLAFLQVNLLPADASWRGAVERERWLLARERYEHRLVLGVGHRGYREVPAWIGPTNETINLIADTTTTLTRVYVQNTTTDTDKMPAGFVGSDLVWQSRSTGGRESRS